MEVTAGGLPCAIKTIKQSQILCDVQAGQSVTLAHGAYNDGLGWDYVKFDLTNVGDVGDYSSLRSKLYNNYQSMIPYIMEQGIVQEIEKVDIDDLRTGYWFKGYFRAPRSGPYKYSLSTDYNGGIWMNKIAYDRQLTNLKLVYSTGYKPYRMYAYYKTDKMASDYIELEEGKLYYMEVVVFNSGGYGSITFSAEVPNPVPSNLPLITVPETQFVSLDYQPMYEIWSIKVWNVSTPFALIF